MLQGVSYLAAPLVVTFVQTGSCVLVPLLSTQVFSLLQTYGFSNLVLRCMLYATLL